MKLASRNHRWVNWHLQNAAKNNRTHPELKDGDMVRFKIKPSIVTKGHETTWSSTRHKVVGKPTGNDYYMPSLAAEHRTSKVFMRHERSKYDISFIIIELRR